MNSPIYCFRSAPDDASHKIPSKALRTRYGLITFVCIECWDLMKPSFIESWEIPFESALILLVTEK